MGFDPYPSRLRQQTVILMLNFQFRCVGMFGKLLNQLVGEIRIPLQSVASEVS